MRILGDKIAIFNNPKQSLINVNNTKQLKLQDLTITQSAKQYHRGDYHNIFEYINDRTDFEFEKVELAII